MIHISSKKKSIYIFVFFLIAFVTILGLPLSLIEPDAALYATISKNIYETNDFINLYSLGYDWLDKPHLPFWITALFFKMFGVSNITYKIPAVLIFFVGVYFTYKFSEKRYNKKTGILAAIILATSAHSVISNFDVRAEPYLTSFIITSIYFIDKYLSEKKIKFLLFSCLFAAFAIMTKGIFILIPIIIAIFGDLVVKKKWNELFNPIWITAILLIFIFILPELYTLYIQFDLHPEKVIFNKTNTSGIKFFFWDSQFGRFFNTAPIKGSGDIFYFLHTILWAFLPWGIIFYIATFFKIKRNISSIDCKEEFYTIFGSLGAILIFSLSKFQLAHYTNIVFPFMSIIVADFIYRLNKEYKKFDNTLNAILKVQNVLVLLFMIFLCYLSKPEINYIFLIIILFYFVFINRLSRSNFDKNIKICLSSAVLFLCVYGLLFTHIYPTILEYQGGEKAAKIINKRYIGKGSLIDNRKHLFGFEFYQEKDFKRIDSNSINLSKDRIFYTDINDLKVFKRKGIHYTIVDSVKNFKVSQLNLNFLNKKTREKSLRTKYLVKVNESIN